MSSRQPILECIIETNDLVHLNFFVHGLIAARSVGRILVGGAIGPETRRGTGFMISPSLLITNHHVLATETAAEESLVEFDYELDVNNQPKPTERFRFAPGELFYAHPTLDFAIVAVDPQPFYGRKELSEYGWLRLDPTPGKAKPCDWLTIVQHPGGDMKRIAVRDNQLLRHDEHMLRYASDTEQGSSGAPVFNDRWQVVALHHACMPAEDPIKGSANENEGIRISVIVQELRKNAPRHPKLDELLALIERPAARRVEVSLPPAA